MQVSNPNNLKIYNLSAGKKLPDWISEHKRRKLQKKDVDIRRRIELIQDFEMPIISNKIKLSPNGQFIIATGTYKPRIRCFDVNHLSMKFERCFDSEVIDFHILSEDYSKIVFLQCDRYIELHAQYGKYYRLRIPKFGRAMVYDYPSCDLYLVGASPEVYRLNLEQGCFLSPFISNSPEFNVCKINPVHNLLVCGSIEGKIEAWDPRSRKRVGILDCALEATKYSDSAMNSLPAITSLAFADGLTMAVGTSTGQVLLYDLRSSAPFLVKDHLYGLPVSNIEFLDGMDLVASMDRKIIRLWGKSSGKTITSLQPGFSLNDLCVVPKTGMMFATNEGRKILTYYIPSIGPAPSWCSFLDNLTEEMEEDAAEVVYDDYKFVTRKELESLGLGQLIGTNLLRAYMHGYFIDARLYRKAKSAAEPFNYKEYHRKKIREKIDEERVNRVKIASKLPSVNRNLAERIREIQNEESRKTKKSAVTNLLKDDRFSLLFSDDKYEIDETSETFRLLNPVVKCFDKKATKKKLSEIVSSQFEAEDEELEGKASSEDDDDDSSDDEGEWVEEVRRQHRLLRHENREKRRQEDKEAKIEPSFYSLKPGEEFKLARGYQKEKSALAKQTLGERLLQERDEANAKRSHVALCHRQTTFTLPEKGSRNNAKKPNVIKTHDRTRHVRFARGIGKRIFNHRGRGRRH